jgi:hypothetical protein
MKHITLLALFAILLAACGGQPTAELQPGQVEVEVTRLVEVEVTRLVETQVEVTRLVEIIATTTPLPTLLPAPTVEIDPTAYIATANVSLADLPTGDPGLVVIAAGPPSNFGVIPVLIRNNTDAPVYNLDIAATARDAAGSVLGTGPGRDIVPSLVPPSGIAFGRILFEDTPLDGATIDYLVTGDPSPRTIFVPHDLEIAEHNLVGGNVGGSLLNTSPTALDSVKAFVICLDDNLTPTTARSSRTDQERVEAGAQIPFSVDLLGDEAQCGRYLLAATGDEAD